MRAVMRRAGSVRDHHGFDLWPTLMRVVTVLVLTLAIPCVVVYLLARQHREREGNAPLRDEIGERVFFRAPLYRASVLGTGGFGGTRGVWIRLRGPKRLTVGADAFMVSAPLASR